MDEKALLDLKKRVVQTNVEHLLLGKNNNIERVKEYLPQIQNFIEWFLQGNIWGIEEDLYQNMQLDIINILNDCVTAIKEDDHVLLQDAIGYGLLGYIELFV